MAYSPDLETTVKSSATDVEAFAEELRKLKLNDLSLMHEAILKDIVKRLLSDIRGDLPEPVQLHARFCAFLIEDALREARNAENRSFIFNAIWAGLNLAMTATLSAGVIERLYAEARSRLGSSGGKKGTASRQLKRAAWTKHATQLAQEAHSRDSNLSNEKMAAAISDHWKLEKPGYPGNRTLTSFVSELRNSGQLPQRSGSLPKRSGSE
jgi:hypothetical protein